MFEKEIQLEDRRSLKDKLTQMTLNEFYTKHSRERITKFVIDFAKWHWPSHISDFDYFLGLTILKQ
jgi:hypothetical protein